MTEADRIRLQHILDAARAAYGFVRGRSREDLDSDLMLRFAILKALEIVGEAARHVSPQGRQACPNLPWPLIVGMRNRLIHGYFDVDTDQVWRTVERDVPELISTIEGVLEEEKS
ncbi:MAG: DUF86 domain-containing protein [Armatimonadetes bacterium]|nr:DUF86 domain-containing protein [Armatimonadota bacterium]